MSQFDIRIGEWRSHLPYQKGISITQTPTKIIYATPNSIVSIDKEELSTLFLSKVNGLSDIGISKVVYDQYNDQVVILYDNSQIDFIRGNEVINVSNIATNTGISGDRQINDIFFDKKNRAFLATGFGLVVLDPNQLIFGTTTFTSIPIEAVITNENHVYSATSEGLYKAGLNNTNLADFGKWELLTDEVGLPFLYEAIDLVVHNGKVILGTDLGLYVLLNNQWKEVYQYEDGERLVFLQSSEDRLIAGWSTGDFNSQVRFFDDKFSWIAQNDGCSQAVKGAIREDEQGRIWYADEIDKFRRSNDYQSPCILESYPSPYSEDVSDMVIDKDLLLAASGGVSSSFGYLFGRKGMYLKSDNIWRNINEFEDPRLESLEALSIFRVAIHPSKNIIYGGSYWAGLLEYDTDADAYQLYNKTNSTLRGSIGDPTRERVTGLAFDQNEHLWVATYNAAEPLNVLTNENEWYSFPVVGTRTLSDITVDQFGYKWCTVYGNSGGVLVFDSGESISDKFDDRQRFISRSNSTITTNQINCILVDREGEVWVGTGEGPVVFDCGADIFDNSCQGSRRIVTQDGIAAFLLADQEIKTMAIDGGNNKWFGTRNGVFVQSPDGLEQIYHFTSDNSPLFDNEIQSLAFDGNSGEMYIGTNRGILSYRTNTTKGATIHNPNDVFAFPNPVRPGYLGPISIRGLVSDAYVQITDIDGVLVSEMRAQGGQAVWNGQDLQGRLAQSGVYLVWSTEPNSFEAPDAFVTKILVVR